MTLNINIDSISSMIQTHIFLIFTIYYLVSYLVVNKKKLFLLLAYFTFSVFLYLLGYSLYSSGKEPDFILFWTRISYTGASLIIYTSCLFSSQIIGKKTRLLNKIMFSIVTFLIIFIWLPNQWLFTDIINSIKTHGSLIKGPLFPYMLSLIFILDLFLLVHFIKGLFKDKERFNLKSPLLFSLIFWFLEAVFDGVFGVMLSFVNMRFSLGPIMMISSLLLYIAKKSEQNKTELIKLKKENIQIYNSLIYDQLSTLYSRSYFLESLKNRVALVERERIMDCLMFIDVDNFKSVNDELGHNHGDKLITFIGEILRHYSRKSDVCARYGGDEFVIMLENCDPENTQYIAESIRENFTENLPELLDNWNGCTNVSLSIGVVCSNDWEGNTSEIIRKADLAMYESKQLGKNKTIFYTDSLNQS